MTAKTDHPNSADDELECDPTFRQEVVDDATAEADARGLPVDTRSRRLLQRYADGKIPFQELQSEIVRLVLH